MKVYTNVKAASNAAGNRAYLSINVGGQTRYIVPEDGEELSTGDGVQLVGPKNVRGGREICGGVNLGHLDRLGNANHAPTPREEWKRATAFAIEERRGLIHSFEDADEAALFELDKEMFLAASRDARWNETGGLSAFEKRTGLVPAQVPAVFINSLRKTREARLAGEA